MKYGIKVIASSRNDLEDSNGYEIIKTERGLEVWYKFIDTGSRYEFLNLNEAYAFKERLNVENLFSHITYLIEEIKD